MSFHNRHKLQSPWLVIDLAKNSDFLLLFLWFVNSLWQLQNVFITEWKSMSFHNRHKLQSPWLVIDLAKNSDFLLLFLWFVNSWILFQRKTP